MIDEEKEDYKEKDIVWVKAKGHPWWPSIINHISFRNIQTNGENIKEKIYSIEFIGEKNNFKVTKEKIEPFYKNYDQRINTKNPQLIKSIELAEKTIEKKQNSKIISLKENNQDTVNDKKDNEKDIDNINDQNIPTKKNHESSEEKSIGEKDSDKNIFLQKKRMNEAIILDENKGENNNKKNIDIKNKEEKKLIPSPKNNIKINININNSNCESLPKTNTYSTINNLSSNKKHFKSFAITNSSSKQNNKNKIVVNLVKKENNENNIINHKNEPKNLSSSFTNMIKKDIILNEHKTNLKNQIFDEKNIINYESPFDLNFIFLYKNEENIKILFEKYLQKKKIGFNIAKEKEKSNNKKSKNKIHYNCHKKNGMKFSVNIAKSLNESNNKIYIWKIKNQSTIKYDFIKLINTFNNSCLK